MELLKILIDQLKLAVKVSMMNEEFQEHFHILYQKYLHGEVVLNLLEYRYDVEKELTTDDYRHCLQNDDSNAKTK
jgi:hypothetical protein